jgi:hypothetical protein
MSKINIIIVSPYYNNSHFIDAQILSFSKYLKNCNWKLLVIDDSNDTTHNIITNEKENIKEACAKYPDRIIYHKYDQSLHLKDICVSQKHRNILNYMFRELAPKLKEEYDYLASFDADMCLIKNYDAEVELSGYDIISPKRTQWLWHYQMADDYYNYPIFDYPFLHCCFFNLNTITNIHEIDTNAINYTTCDTGSMIVKFFLNNPEYKIKYYSSSCGGEYLSSMNYFEFYNNNTFIHYGTGTLWYNRSEICNTYSEKYNAFMKLIESGLTSEDDNIINTDRLSTYSKFYIYVKNSRYATEEELRRYVGY